MRQSGRNCGAKYLWSWQFNIKYKNSVLTPKYLIGVTLCHKSDCRLKDIFPWMSGKFLAFFPIRKTRNSFSIFGAAGRERGREGNPLQEYKLQALCFVVTAFPDDKWFTWKAPLSRTLSLSAWESATLSFASRLQSISWFYISETF